MIYKQVELKLLILYNEIQFTSLYNILAIRIDIRIRQIRNMIDDKFILFRMNNLRLKKLYLIINHHTDNRSQ